MIYVGNKKLKKCFLGNGPIQRVYLGPELLFLAPTFRLPDGYTEIEYIESSGTQYIDTGVKPDGGTPCQTKVVADIQCVGQETSNRYYFGCYTTYYNYNVKKTWKSNYCAYRVSGSGNYANIQTAASISAKKINEASNSRIIVTLDGPNSTASVEENSVSISSAHVISSMPSIFLLCESVSGYPSGLMSAKLWSAQIEQNGALIRDFVPCIDPSGAVGLYDMVNKAFYPNADTGDNFIAGPAV